jgi:3-mercaptopropionate dioxygenase
VRLVTAIRAAVGDEAPAEAVAEVLRAHLPSPDVLTPQQRTGDPDRYRTHLLHAEADFSIVALVWRPGQATPIHDHVTWCVFGVIQGVEYEELFALDEERACLVPAGVSLSPVGEVTGFAPPGDIHRVRNVGDETAISIHVYGADLRRIASSVRRTYNLPVRVTPTPVAG